MSCWQESFLRQIIFNVTFILQVAIENKKTLFIDDPNKFPGLEKNEDYIKYGYAYYVGAPWVVGQTRGI